ncbi:MAG: LPS export ABC transporter permease LptG [Methylococcales symbiont of Iophon sp. n. MRB-2018]|nr:MAG: LPS export ABC transporter permease LptG [Methylococcales symbiont of Iophon sp. n. MRB-2018]KAF3980565.1 MAG: LPS export ABC transporter permease LptG [Methylococcales symbiont of Iophon sp. n. MRB-2018]
MNVLTFYIVREVLKGSFVALGILLTLFNLFTLSDELKDVGTGSYGLKEVFIYLLLTSPRVLYELVPSAALLGSLFVVGAMGNHREIVAMRAAGLPIFWVIKSVMLAGVVLVVIAVFVGEFIAPDAEQKAQLLKINTQNDKVIMQSKHGLWLREGAQFINVRKIKEKGHLADIYIYQMNDANTLSLMTQVKQAHFVGDGQWNMQGIRQSEFSFKQVFSKSKEQMDWKTSIDPDLLNVVVVKSDNMSLYDLFMYIDFLRTNNQKSQTYELAFWSRLINPFVTFVMLMVSIPFVVGAGRGVSTGSRMMLGIIMGMTFNIFDKIAGHVGLVYDFNPMLMAILPSILVFCGATYAVSRVR